MAPSSVRFPNVLANAAQAPLPPSEDPRRSKTSPGGRDRTAVSGGTPGSAGATGAERAGAPASTGTDGLEPDWSSTTDAATD